MPTKLAPESYLQKRYSSWEYGNDNSYRGKLPLRGIDFLPHRLSLLGRFFPAQDSEQLCWQPALCGSWPAEEGQAAGRALAPAAAGIVAAASPATRGGARVTHPSSLSFWLWSRGSKRLQKDESCSHEWGNGSINDWWNISIYWFKSILFSCLAFVF